jgi:hypothetical protein
MKDLPKWFTNNGGAQYKKGGEVTNQFTGASATLNANELSMYDFIMGCQMITMDRDIQQDFRKALDWIRQSNPGAYMALLD